MSLNYNIPLVGQWAHDRNLIEGSTPKAQFLKHVEEGGEVFEGILKQDKDLVVDAIGDTCVVITIILLQLYRKPQYYITGSRVDTKLIDIELNKYNNFHQAVAEPPVGNAVMLFGQAQGELARALAKGLDPLKEIINVINSLKVLCELLCIDFSECYRLAYNEIKHRKGKMVDGVFVKEEV